MNRSKYNPELDLLKFLFSIVVVIYHSKYIYAIGSEALLPYGFTAVEFFFIVSGYLMVKSSKKFDQDNIGKNAMSFVYNKAKALYPEFFFAFVLSFIMREILLFIEKDYTVFDFGKDIVSSIGELLFLMKTGINFGTIFNGPTWYIGAMFFGMLILFPILLKHREWFLNVGSIIIAVLLYGYHYTVKHSLNYLDWADFTTSSIIRAVAGLCLGCFACGLIERLQEKNIELKVPGKLLLAITEFGLLALILFIMQHEGKNNFDYVCLVYIFLLCLIAFSGLTGIKDILPRKICSFLGNCSFLIYLNHRYLTRFFNIIELDIAPLKALVLLLILTALMSAICELTVTTCKIVWKKVSPKLKNILIK